MSLLAVYADTGAAPLEVTGDFSAMAESLGAIGVRFERWTAAAPLAEDAPQEAILAAYAESVERLKGVYGFQSADVISVTPEFPEKVALRQKFLSEHTHIDFEVRFFVGGRGLFFLHPDDKVYAVLCEQGDLISVPADVKHWFDMGAEPELKCIRLFTTPDGWVAQFTGDDIAERLPKLEQFLAEHRP
ncbi:1,2-dihydroxy-3-keto-5-methylthiopentene dioxygenase [Methylogaea oryzae]|uniref:Acireductone dioxygenase n=1 Tax=Methylogaea oryzae TaxID=1295382 RepID=A0A8D5AKV4_9GAMM|nr:cupin [Methylogaea oryzae]BBL72194.1 acireductone dioxygenase [Methylogaea oryzae]